MLFFHWVHSSPMSSSRMLQQPPATLLGRLLSQITLTGGPHETIAVQAPYTGSPIGTIPAGTVADLELAVQRARAEQAGWSTRTFADRAGIFLRFRDLLLERQDEVLDLIQWETGKARRHAFEEILDTAAVTRYYARRAERLLRPRRRKGALPLLTLTREFKSPVGVVGLIVPWNYPLNLAVTDAVPALMAGNAAVLKPDVQTSFTALWAVDLLRHAGLPPDVFGVVTGEGPRSDSSADWWSARARSNWGPRWITRWRWGRSPESGRCSTSRSICATRWKRER